MRRTSIFAVVAVALGASSSWGAALSGNLIAGGNFEGTPTYFKNASTYDSLSNEVPAHRFNREGDLGKWLEFWGDPNLYVGINPAWAGLGGFTSLDDPRTPGGLPMTRDDRKVSNMNRSYNAGTSNHYLDNTMFRPHFGEWFAAPANQVRGPVQFSFDFYYDDWDQAAHDPYNDHLVNVQLYGTNFLPPHNVTILDQPAGSFFQPLGDDPVFNPAPGFDGEILANFTWGGWTTDDDWNDDDDTGGWITLTSDNPSDPNWTRGRSWAAKVPTNLTKTYQYYALVAESVTYNESSLLFSDSLGHGDIVPTFSQGFDNFNFKVLTALLADTNLDTLRNALDIQSFVARVTGSLPYMAEADCNQDGVVNALDIQKFVYYITGGTGSVVPEPATLGLLALGLLGLARRR